MNIPENLAIVLVTYNRAEPLRHTLNALLAAESPVRNCRITVQNNRSTDATGAIVDDFAARFPNVTHVVNNFNVGGNANIAKALERCSTPYHWVLCDDDVYDWTGWPDVEAAMARGEKVICVGDRHLPPEGDARRDPAQLLQQMTFLPSIIYGPGIINDTSLRNAYDNVFALFQHLAPVVQHLNNGGSICVTDRGIVRPGDFNTDISYTRGCDKSQVFPVSRTMILSAGFAHATSWLKDRELGRRAFKALVFGSQMGALGFFGEVFARLPGADGAANFRAILRQSPFWARCVLRAMRIVQCSPLYALITSPKLYRAAQKFVDRRNAKALKELHG